MNKPRALAPVVRSFNLSRWFAIVGLVSIATISAIAGWAMSRFVTNEMLQQEGELTQQFVQTLVQTERSLQTYFAFGQADDTLELELAMSHISRMQDMLRANVYNREQRVIWSSDRSLEGKTFGPNDELDEALAGHLVVHADEHDEHGTGKSEHTNLEKRADLFVEIYVPVRAPSTGEVIGAIEFYKNPLHLFHALERMNTYVALGAALVVAVNSDDSVRRLGKGTDRPVNGLADRAALLAALESVDLVTWFEEDTPIARILECRPDVLVKGGDWRPEDIVGAREVTAWGGRVASIPFLHQRSTTTLLDRIRASR